MCNQRSEAKGPKPAAHFPLDPRGLLKYLLGDPMAEAARRLLRDWPHADYVDIGDDVELICRAIINVAALRDDGEIDGVAPTAEQLAAHRARRDAADAVRRRLEEAAHA